MSEENVALVRMLIEKFKAGDHEGVFQYYDERIEWDATRGVAHVPDLAAVYHGHDGVRAYWRTWMSAWEPIDTFEYELRDAGDQVLMFISAQRNRGRHSGLEVELPPYVLLFTLRDGKVTRWRFFSDESEALEAAGVAP